MRAGVLGILALIGCASYLSHQKAPPDAGDLDGKRVVIEHVIDGDTVVIRTETGRQRVRLRGIDAPELDPPMHWGDEARRYLDARIGNKPVVLKFDPPQTHDRYGRLLAFLYVNEGECVNLSLVREGQAYADRRFDSFLRSQLEQAETQARRKKTGLWKALTDDRMPPWRREWLAKRNQSGR